MPIAHVKRRWNHLPTIARLTIESAVWPRPRVKVTATSSGSTPDTWLIASTTTPSRIAMAVSTTRDPRRSRRLPTP